MNGRCTLTIRGQEISFHFSINGIMEFADNRGVGLHEIDKYVSANPHTSMRGLFFYAARLAAAENEIRLNFNELEFGEMMSQLAESDYKKLIEAYKSSKPDQEKKKGAEPRMKTQTGSRLHLSN